MDPTTLITFLFRSAPTIRRVELTGSWDNFRQSYTMQQDRRRGAGIWTGCFKFTDIIFDGDTPHRGKPRAGGLKQGGTYWYFYRLDDEREIFDECQPSTSECPLLPGQVVNVLEVPSEVQSPPVLRRSLSLDSRPNAPAFGGGAAVRRTGSFSVGTGGRDRADRREILQTLEPSDKFAALEPPPVSRVHGRCVSDLALNGRLEHVQGDQLDEAMSKTPVSPCTPLSRESPRRPKSPNTRKRERTYPAGAAFGERSRRSLSQSRDSSSSSSIRSASHSSVVDAETVEPLDGVDSDDNDDDEGAYDYTPKTLRGRLRKAFWNPFVDQQHATALPAISEDTRPTTAHGEQPRSNFWSRRHHNKDHPPRLATDNQQEIDGSNIHHPSSNASSPRKVPSAKDNGHSSDSNNDNDEDDMCSPTFSALTVSSSGGGVNTPWRLSLGLNRLDGTDGEEHRLNPLGISDPSLIHHDGTGIRADDALRDTDEVDFESEQRASLQSLTNRLDTLPAQPTSESSSRDPSSSPARQTHQTTVESSVAQADEAAARKPTSSRKDSSASPPAPSRAPPPPPAPASPISSPRGPPPPSRLPPPPPPIRPTATVSIPAPVPRARPNLAVYSLPCLAEESYHSLGKVSTRSARDSIDADLATPRRREGFHASAEINAAGAGGGGGGMAAIFDELGYLGGSIN